MVFCFIAAGLFSVMGVFSAKYRRWAGEAWKCAFKKMTFRPCDSNFDERWRGKLTARLGELHPTIGKFFYKNFQAISLLFVLVMLGSMVSAGFGAYNWAAYQNCNGPHSTQPCEFNQMIGAHTPHTVQCGGTSCAMQCDCSQAHENPLTAGKNCCGGNCDCNSLDCTVGGMKQS